MTNQTNLIIIDNGRAITNSLTVASVFNKRHDNILSKISKLNNGVKGLLKNQESYFTESTYFNEQNKEQPCYNISRDGFVLLTMGFNGKKALEFKLKYIEAFNAMEAKLKELGEKPDFTTVLTTVKQHNRKLPTMRVKKELVLPADTYKNIGGVVKACVKSEMDKYMRLIREPELDFAKLDMPIVKQLKMSHFTKLEKAIEEYGKMCELMGSINGVTNLQKILPSTLVTEINKHMKKAYVIGN